MSQLEELQQQQEPKPQLPMGDKHYVACRGCHTILTEPQYLEYGCEKCGEGAPDTRDGLLEHTTTRFHHIVGLVAPQHSWIARLIGCSHMPTSVYAAALDDEEDEAAHALDDEGEYEEDEDDDVIDMLAQQGNTSGDPRQSATTTDEPLGF